MITQIRFHKTKVAILLGIALAVIFFPRPHWLHLLGANSAYAAVNNDYTGPTMPETVEPAVVAPGDASVTTTIDTELNESLFDFIDFAVQKTLTQAKPHPPGEAAPSQTNKPERTSKPVLRSALGTATHFIVTVPITQTAAGTLLDITVIAADAAQGIDTVYTNTVTFTSSDPLATLPEDYTFTLDDNGQHTFSGIALGTAGTQTITITDETDSSIQSDITVEVGPGIADAVQAQVTVTGPHLADGVDAATVAITVTDSFDNPISGAEVWLVPSGSENQVTPYPAVTDAHGQVLVTFTSTQPEAKAISFVINDHNQASVPVHTPHFIEFTGAVITGTVFSDPNRDNVQQAGESGLGGVQLNLYRDGDPDFLKQTVTEDDGSYRFSSLVPDTYHLVQPRLGSYAFTLPADTQINVTGFELISNINFGSYDAAHVIGRVWSDGNQDGQVQEDEPGIANATISAYDEQNLLVGSTTSDANGDYQLDLAADIPAAPNNFTFSSDRFRIQEPATAVASNFDFIEMREVVEYPINHDFADGRTFAPDSNYPLNYAFTEGRILLPTSTYPPNYSFDSGDLTSWTASNTSYVQVISDTSGIDGPYLYIGRETESVESAPFTVPATAQSVRFDYAAWYLYNSTHDRKIHVYALTGPDFSTSTPLGYVIGRGTQGWKQGVLDLQAVQGQTIKLRFYLENVGSSRARLDNIVLAVETPDWTPSDTSHGYVQVISDTSGIDGPYLYISRETESVESAPFTVPATAQSVRFDYAAWYLYNSDHDRKIHVYALTGPDFSTSTPLGYVIGRGTQGWKQGVLDLQAVQGQTIKLRFYLEDVGSSRARLDNIVLAVEAPDWTPSDTSHGYVQVISDTNNIDGPYLYIGRETESVESAPLTVPATAQSVRFDYAAWYLYNSDHDRKIHVYALTGPDFSSSTHLGYVIGRGKQGWKQGVLDLQAVQGQTIKLRFYLENVGSSRARLDNIVLAVETPDWTPSDTSHGYVQVISDTSSIDGPYLYIGRETESIESAPFTVPATAQSVRFDYAAWYLYNSDHDRKIHVYALTGPDFSSSTHLGYVIGRGKQGWKQGVLDLQAVQGQTIKLQFYLENVGDSRARLDNIVLATETPDWTPSNTSYGYVQIINDGNSIDGPYLYIGRETETIESAPFTVPTTTQSVRFDYAAWYLYNSTHDRKIHVYALTGPDFSTSTSLGYVTGRGNQGWKQGVLDLQAVQGQTIKLQFYLENVGDSRARLDNVYLLPWSTVPYTITQSNLPSYTSTTPDTFGVDAYGGAAFYLDFGDFAVDAFNSTVLVTPTNVVAGESTNVIITLKDANDEPLSGYHVEISGPGSNVTITQPVAPTDALGQTTGSLVATTAPQTILVTARSVEGNVVLDEVVPLSVSPAPVDPDQSTFVAAPTYVVANGIDAANFTVTLRDAYDNVAAGRVVTLTHTGTSVSLTTAMTQTNAFGQISGVITATEAQPVTLFAHAEGVTLKQTPVITFTGISPDLSSFVVQPDTLIADHMTPALITVTLRDQNGDPFPNKPVALTVVGKDSYLNGEWMTGTVSLGNSNLAGVVTATLTSPTVGPQIITAVGDNIQLADPITVTFTVGPVDLGLSSVTVLTDTVIADGLATTLVTATLYDSYDHPIPGKEVSIQTTGQLSLTQPITLTDELGQVQAVLSSTEVQKVVVTAVDQTDGITLTQEIPVSFVAGPIDITQSVIDITPTTLTADGIQTTTITLTLRDTLGHPVLNRSVQLIDVASDDYTVTPDATATTDMNGVVVYTIASTKAEVKTFSLRDLAYDTVLPLSAVTFVAGDLDPAPSRLEIVGNDTAVADGSETIAVRVTAFDQYQNPIEGAAVTLTASESVVINQPANTDEQGETTGSLRSDQVQQATIGAVINGQTISDTITATFVGPDLSLTHEPLALQAYTSLPYTYTIQIENKGVLPANQVTITDSLPAELAFVEQTADAGLAFSQVNADLVWTTDELVPGQMVSINVVVRPDANLATGTQLTHSLTVAAQSGELNRDNNNLEVTIAVEKAAPKLLIAPGSLDLSVLPEQTAVTTISVQNVGVLPMTNTVLIAPEVMPWVSLSMTSIPELAPGQQVDVDLTAAPPSSTLPGTYRDLLVVTGGSGGEQRAIVKLFNQPPTQTLQVTVANDLGQPVADAWVGLELPDGLVDVTPAFNKTINVYAEDQTDENGHLQFPSLQTGKYNVTVAATSHRTVTGTLSITETGSLQEVQFTLEALSQISYAPASPEVSVVPGETAAQVIEIVNEGAAPLANLSITSPSSEWVYVGAPSLQEAVLYPGERLQFTLYASPEISQTAGIYQEQIIIRSGESDIDPHVVVPVLIRVSEGATRDVRFDVTTLTAQVLADAEVALIQQEPTIIFANGITNTVQQHFSQLSDGSGSTTFSGLPTGVYDYTIRRQGYKTVHGLVEVVPASESIAQAKPSVVFRQTTQVDTQTIVVQMQADPFLYAWRVNPEDQHYYIEVKFNQLLSEDDELSVFVPPRKWSFSSCNTNPIYDTFTVYNLSSSEITISGASVSVPGVSANVLSVPGTLAPGESGSVSIEASRTGSVGTGEITLNGTYQATVGNDISYIFNPSSFTSQDLVVGQTFNKDYLLEPVIFDEAESYQLTITQTTTLDWVTLTSPNTGAVSLDANSQIPFTLAVTPPEWLAPGVYQDKAVMSLSNSEGAIREGYLTVKIIQTQSGDMELHTAFELEPPELEERPLSGAGSVQVELKSCEGGSGTNGVEEEIQWETLPESDGGGLIGIPTDPAAGLPGSQWGNPAQVTGDASQEIQLVLSQELVLEGESFQAALTLHNILWDESVDDVAVELLVVDGNDVDFTHAFYIEPAETIGLGTILGRQQKTAAWLITPNQLNVTDPAGQDFQVAARVQYRWNGELREFTTRAHTITVFPSPELIIRYELPETSEDFLCQEFDLVATIQNVGNGPARNVRLLAAELLLENGNLPQGFEITAVLLDDESLAAKSVDVIIGDIAAGAERTVTWRIRGSAYAQFSAFTSDFRLANYEGRLMAPLIREIYTTFNPDYAHGCVTVDNPNVGSPDLVVAVVDSPTSVDVDETVQIQTEITNEGGLINEVVPVRFEYFHLMVDTGWEEVEGGVHSNVTATWEPVAEETRYLQLDLDHGESLLVTDEFTPPYFANYQLRVTVDPES